MDAIPILTLKRLPQYLEVLHELKREGHSVVSATKIASITGVHMTQVRKDLAYTGVVGVPKVGHGIDDLIKAIGVCLNWNDISTGFLVGVGHLGSALLGYDDLPKMGLKIVAAFDNNPDKIGRKINDIPIIEMDKFGSLARRLRVYIGIITTPREHAQSVADLMISSGILAIWNFTTAHLTTPEDIIVENVDMTSSLAVLSRRLAERFDIEPGKKR